MYIVSRAQERNIKFMWGRLSKQVEIQLSKRWENLKYTFSIKLISEDSKRNGLTKINCNRWPFQMAKECFGSVVNWTRELKRYLYCLSTLLLLVGLTSFHICRLEEGINLHHHRDHDMMINRSNLGLVYWGVINHFTDWFIQSPATYKFQLNNNNKEKKWRWKTLMNSRLTECSSSSCGWVSLCWDS